MMTKETVTNAIKDMPQEFDLDALFQKLVFIERVEAAREQVEKGQTVTHSEMKNIIASWRR